MESDIKNKIMLGLQEQDEELTLFNCPTGAGYLSYKPVPGANYMRFGLTKGGADVIGWKTVEITPEMVGKKIAVFTALEIKTATGKASSKQENFIERVQASGGIAGVAKTIIEASGIISSWQKLS